VLIYEQGNYHTYKNIQECMQFTKNLKKILGKLNKFMYVDK